jgi:hypothetical protein
MDRLSFLQIVNTGNGYTAGQIAKALSMDEAEAIGALKVMVTEKTIRTMECGTLLDSAGLSSTTTVVEAAGSMDAETRFFMTIKGKATLILGAYVPELLGSVYSKAQSRFEQKALPPAPSTKDDDTLG